MIRRIAVLALVLGLVSLLASAAYATRPAPEHRVTICHATPPDTAANGWVQITVDIASVGYQHSGHESEHDADIIPPYSYGDYSFPGKNWDEAGQAVWNNGCETPPVETTTTTQPESTTTTQPQCDCESTTTTQPEVTTTTSPPETTSTTVPPTVTTLPPPTTSPPPSTSTPKPPATKPPGPKHTVPTPPIPAAHPVLPHTGSEALVLALIGLVLVIVGAGIWLGIKSAQWRDR